MKAQILKIAGVKSEKEFYKKYPSEEAFMKVHGKAFKKAQTSNAVEKAQAGITQAGADLNGNGIADYLEPTAPNQLPQSAQSPQVPQGPQNQTNVRRQIQPMSLPQPAGPKQLVQSAAQTVNQFQAQNQPEEQGGGALGGFMEALPGIGAVFGAFSAFDAEKEAVKKARQDKAVSDIQSKAAGSRPEPIQRKYVRPEDALTSGNQVFPTMGLGTNVLKRNGGFVKYEGGGEIQNTYAPGTLYDDLGYEPLNDPSMVKAYRHGGHVPQAQSGFSNFMSSGGGDLANRAVGNAFAGNAGAGIGSAVGDLIPVPGAGAVLGLVGGLIDQNPREIKRLENETRRNQERVMLNQTLPAIQAGYASHMKDGGWVSHDWQPQVIASFGEHSMKKLLAPDKTMDTLRSGGHISGRYTQPSSRALETMALGGEVKTTWGGHAETISQNPYMPGTGETINFYGQSHDDSDGNGNTGIGVKYGQGGHDSYTDYAEYGTEQPDADVEVERGEPSFEMMDPETGEKNLTVLGNLKFDKKIAAQTGDDDIISLADKYNGKKFKNIGLDLSKQENKYTKLIEKSTDALDGLDVKNSFDRLTLASNQANIKAGQMGLQKIADQKMTLAHFQNAINDASEENFLVADDLAKGKGTYDKKAGKEAFAKWGNSIKKAQVGVTQPAAPATAPTYVSKHGIDPWLGNFSKNDPYGKAAASSFTAEQWDDIADRLGFKGKGNEEFQKFLLDNPDSKKMIDARHLSLYGRPAFIDPKHHGAGWASNKLLYGEGMDVPVDPETGLPVEDDENATYQPIEYKQNKIIPFANQLLGFLRPSDAMGLDPQQLAGEMYALTNNLVDPVKVQTYQPELSSPYDISLQDQMNEITAQTRAAQRMSQGNPEAQAIIAANAYDAINKVKGEEFRANQAMKDKVYGENRNALNAAKLQNLNAYDQQYVRQSQAASNTKEVTQAALSSISDKYLKNKLENRKLQTYENLYNYRYDAQGRLINMNGIYQPTVPQFYGGKGTVKMVKTTDAAGNTVYKMMNDNGKEVKPSTTSKSSKNKPAKGKFQKPPMVTDIETPTLNNTTPAFTMDASGNTVPRGYEPIEEEDPYGMVSGKGKNGKKVKPSNGSILKAIKNL